MNTIKKAVFCFLVLSFNMVKAQYLTIDDITNIQQHDMERVKGFFAQTNWNFYSSKVDIEKYIGYQLEYNEVGWTYNYNEYSETAKGWAYLLQKSGYKNIFVYNTTKNHFNDIEKVAKSKYIFVETIVGNNELKSIYKNIQGLEIWFIAKKPTEEYTEDENTSSVFYAYDKADNYYYTIVVLNKNDLDKRIDELKKDEEYNTLIGNGNSSFDSNNLNEAIAFYQQASLIKPNESYSEEKISAIKELILKNEKYNSLIKDADLNFNVKKFIEAKKTYEAALLVKSNENYPKTKILEINKITSFLEERKTKVYSYKEINKSEFDSYESYLISETKALLKNEIVDASVNMKIIITTDVMGMVVIKSENISATNQTFVDKINSLAISKKPKAAYLFDYPVSSNAEMNISLQFENKEIKVKKYNDELKMSDSYSIYSYDVKALISNTPNGYYKIGIHKKSINNNDFSDHKINNYRTFGGMSSAFLSVLIPGLGDVVVTGGKSGFMGFLAKKEGGFMNRPLATTFTVYSLIGVGAYYKMLSNQDFDKYLSATDQTEMDQYYTRANQYHHRAIIIAGTGVLLWASDIIWVAVKGHQNKKETKDFRRQYSFNYNPQFNALSLGFSQKF